MARLQGVQMEATRTACGGAHPLCVWLTDCRSPCRRRRTGPVSAGPRYATVLCGVLPDGLGVCDPVRMPGRWCTVRVIHVPRETTTIGLPRSPMPYTKEPYQAVIWALCEQMGCQKGVGNCPRNCTKA